MAYKLTLGFNDQISAPLGRLVGRYDAAVRGMIRKAAGLGGLMRPALGAVERLDKGLASLSKNRKLSVDDRQVEAASREVDGLDRKLTKLDRHGRLRLANGRFAGMGGGAASAKGGVGGSGLSVGGLMAGATPYIVAAAAGAAVMNFGQKAMARERDEFSLGVMLKSPELASNLMGQFQAFAKKNPLLGMPEVTEAGTRLVSLNERTDRVMPIVSMLGDVAAGTKNNLSDIVTILGQVKSKGRMMAEENMQFQERRINLNPYLAKVTGVKENQLAALMKDGRIGYEQVLRAINLMTAKGGIYHNMSERTGNETAEGRYKNLLETLELNLTSLAVRALPILNNGLTWATGLVDGLDKSLSGGLGTSLIGAANDVASLGGSLWGFAQATGLVGTKADETGSLLRGLQTGLETLGSLARWVGVIFRGLDKVPFLKRLLGQATEGMVNPLGGLFGEINKATTGILGNSSAVVNAQPPMTPEEKARKAEERWVKANKLRNLSSDEQHERFVEAKWRAAQGAAFYALSEAEKHTRFVAAQARGMQGRSDLLGASGMLSEEAFGTKKKKKGHVEGAGTADGSSTSGVSGHSAKNVAITIKTLIEGGIHLHAATVREGMAELENIIMQTVVRAVESGAVMN